MLKVIALLTVCGLLLSSGQAEDLVVDWQADPTLKLWPSLLPTGWSLKAAGNSLIIEREQPIWVLLGSKQSSGIFLEDDRQRADRIRQMGQRLKSNLTFNLRPRRWPQDLWKDRASLPDYLSRDYEIRLINRIGIEDEFHSVEPAKAVAELLQVQKLLIGSLAIVLRPGQDLGDYQDRLVVLAGNQSQSANRAPAIATPYMDYGAYMTWGNRRLAVYSGRPLPNTPFWELTAKVVAAANSAGDVPYYLLVSSVQAW